MEAVLQNSTISSTNLSHTSNPSTARLLIDHIKRLVEDDMKLTVEAFKIIENEIFFDHRNESIRKRNSSNRSSNRSQHSRSPYTKQSELSLRKLNDQHFTPTSGGSIFSSDFSTDKRFDNNTNQMQKTNSLEKSPATSTPIRNRSMGSGKQFQNQQRSRLSLSQLISQNYTDREELPVTSSTPRGSSFNVSSIQRTKSEDSKFSKKNSSPHEKYRRMSISPNVQSYTNLGNSRSSDKLPNTNSNHTSNLDVTTDDNIDEEFISLTRVASMFHSRFTEEIKKVMDRIHERFKSESLLRIENAKKPGLQTITRRVYDDISPVWTYGNGASSVDTPQQSSYSIKDRKMRLPQLLAFGGISQLQGSHSTIDGENIARFDSKYKRNVEPSETDDKAKLSDDAIGDRSDEKINERMDETNESVALADIVNKVALTAAEISDGEIDATDNGTEHIDENVEGCNETTDNKTQKSTCSADDVNNTNTDEHKVTEPEPSKTTDIVTITDIGSETTFTKSPNNILKTPENDLPRDEELTDTFSSSLVATPKTAEGQTSREWTDLDEIASLINQASPSRRIVIKKKLPDVSVKGYSKICNEKIIFSGNKITHVKTDRKTMCRDYNPKNNTEN